MGNEEERKLHEGENDMSPKLLEKANKVSDQEKESLLRFIGAFKNKSKVDTDQICREVRGKE